MNCSRQECSMSTRCTTALLHNSLWLITGLITAFKSPVIITLDKVNTLSFAESGGMCIGHRLSLTRDTSHVIMSRDTFPAVYFNTLHTLPVEVNVRLWVKTG